MNNRLITILSRAFLALSAAFVALVLLSWLLAAARPDFMVRSLLAPEGIRWFFRNLSHIIASPLLGWMLLWSMAFGCISDSRLLCGVRNIRSLSSREQFALMMVVVELIVSVLLLFLLTLVPHAILL
ncbi:MAG: ABC transporter substrate-binding protein, partial [Prevotella sp.]|nr:ABC transporter substrate-binding protein [Prevotella sp.]